MSRNFCPQSYVGAKARYIGRDGGQTWGGEELHTGDLIPDPTGLNAKKAPNLFEHVPGMPAEVELATRSKRGGGNAEKDKE